MTGIELRSLRRNAGLTQSELGDALHVSGAFIGEMERGEKAIRPATEDLANLLFGARVTVGEFGKKFVVIISRRIRGQAGRTHHLQPSAYDTEAEAEAVAEAIAEREPGWRYVARRRTC